MSPFIHSFFFSLFYKISLLLWHHFIVVIYSSAAYRWPVAAVWVLTVVVVAVVSLVVYFDRPFLYLKVLKSVYCAAVVRAAIRRDLIDDRANN